MKQSKDYKTCQHEDLDPFNGCKPVNCELKYFGKRNYFENPRCVPAKVCDHDLMYDYETNECRDPRNILNINDVNEIESGMFTNWIDASEAKLTDGDSISCNVR